MFVGALSSKTHQTCGRLSRAPQMQKGSPFELPFRLGVLASG